MMNRPHYRPATAISLTLAVAIAAVAPIVNLKSASAQLFPSHRGNHGQVQDRTYDRGYEQIRDRRAYNSVVIPVGTQLPIEYEKEKILVTPDETTPITLLIAADIKDGRRQILIPYGTEVRGQIEPAGRGSRFVAQELIFADGSREFIDATSDVVTRTTTVKRGTDSDDIIKGAAIGGAAAAVLGEVFGDLNLEEVLGGAAVGALGGWLFGRKSVELISIDPNRDLDITLESALALR